MTWCWHPHHHSTIRPVVREEDYRCCCNALTIKTGFTIFIILDVICLLLSIATFFFDDNRFRTWGGPFGVVGIVMIVIAVLAITSLKPVYMQVYGIVFAVQLVCSILMAGFILLIFGFTGFGMTIVRADNEAQREARAVAAWVSMVAIICLVIYIAVLIWRAVVTYRFYQYLRDRQLGLEYEPHVVNTGYSTGYTTAHSTHPHTLETPIAHNRGFHQHTTVIETK